VSPVFALLAVEGTSFLGRRRWKQDCDYGKCCTTYVYIALLRLSFCNPGPGVWESMIDTAANLVAIALRYLDQLLHQAEFGLATPRPNSSWWGAFV
jgi:hypothetical protein